MFYACSDTEVKIVCVDASVCPMSDHPVHLQLVFQASFLHQPRGFSSSLYLNSLLEMTLLQHFFLKD